MSWAEWPFKESSASSKVNKHFMTLFHFPFQSFCHCQKEYSTASLSLEKIGILMSFVKDLLITMKNTTPILMPVSFAPMWLCEHKLASQDTSIAGFLIQFNLKIVHLLLDKEVGTPSMLSSPESESLSWTEPVALMLRQLKPKLTDGNRHWTVQRPPGIHPL